MNNNTPESILARVAKLIRNIREILLGLSAFCALVFGASKAGFDVDVLALVLLSIGVAVWCWLWGILLRRRVREKAVVDARGDPVVSREARHSKGARKLAAFGLVLLPLLAVALWLGSRMPKLNPGAVHILVTWFDGPKQQNYRVTETLVDQLRRATEDQSDVRISVTRDSISVVGGSMAARKIGIEKGASVVIWGWYGATDERTLITAHIELVNRPRELPLRRDERGLNVSVAELVNFKVQETLSQEMAGIVLLTSAVARFEAGQYLTAITQFDRVLRTKSKRVKKSAVLVLRGTSNLLLSNFEDAIADLTEATKLEPELSAAHCALGQALRASGKVQLGIGSYNQAIVTTPNFYAALNNLGTAQIDAGDYILAVENLSAAIKINPDLAAAYNNRGTGYRNLKLFDEAREDYDRAIKLRPDLARAYINRGILHKMRGEKDRAIVDFRRALRLSTAPAIRENAKRRLDEVLSS